MTLPFISSLSDISRRFLLVAVGLLLVTTGSPTRAAEGDPDINLRLFGKNVIEEFDGCRLAFWQANRDPEKDTYSYVFFAPFNDGEELPGWMKIDDTVFLMNREDSASVNTQALEPLRLYRTSKGSYTALIEVLEQHVAGNNILVDKGQITITRSDHYPFVITVKGGIICASQPEVGSDDHFAVPDGLVGDTISLDPPRSFSDLSAVPQGILDVVARDAPDCRPSETTGNGARYAISDAMTLWELPCQLYPRSWSNVYVTALNENAAYSNVLFLPGVPDHGDL
ncbi:hypothetical protein, partial [uncultured Cohaesibacter sp.]|uniref:hypothetical protein n=1 Tax=uncultured Cohaesibacter sp. TaxID=1002546 RepID=UPI0029C8A754